MFQAYVLEKLKSSIERKFKYILNKLLINQSHFSQENYLLPNNKGNKYKCLKTHQFPTPSFTSQQDSRCRPTNLQVYANVSTFPATMVKYFLPFVAKTINNSKIKEVKNRDNTPLENRLGSLRKKRRVSISQREEICRESHIREFTR